MQKLLDAAGEQVEVCHDRDWGCVGMDGACPLDDGEVDVAVAVAEPGVAFDAQGVACVHRARIPLVTVGARTSDPVTEYATENVDRIDDDSLEVIRRAAQDVTGYRRAVEDELATRLADDEQVDISVHRRPGAIEVVLTGTLDPPRAAALSDVARAVIRHYDVRVPVINVSVSAP